jgi:16S rRNA (uracil1498-N3)-methyltransferase
MHYFFCDKIRPAEETILIDGPDARHMKNVLRLKTGDRLGLLDGRGMEYTAAIQAFLPEGVQLRLISGQPSRNEPPVALTVAQAILKDRKMDRIVRQLTELGASEWLPFDSQYAVPKPDARKMAARSERWKRIAREALKQCRRGRVMVIRPAVSFEEMIAEGQSYDLRVVFWENQSAFPSASAGLPHPRDIRRIFAAIGPEGGFSATEIEAARAAGFVTAGLGPRILRADTAAVAAACLLQFLYGDLGEKDLDKSAVIE